MRSIPSLCLILLVVCQSTDSLANDGPHSDGWVSVPAKENNVDRTPRVPSFDFKRQKFPKKSPTDVMQDDVPRNLDLLIDQLLRHSELDNISRKIMPWIYGRSTEFMVAEYEDAILSLEQADAHLQIAIRQLLVANAVSLEHDSALKMAELEIDRAEFTIRYLLELAKLEL